MICTPDVCRFLDGVGLANALYLTLVFYFPNLMIPVFQPILRYTIQSGKAAMFGVPVAAWGALTYGLLFAGTFFDGQTVGGAIHQVVGLELPISVPVSVAVLGLATLGFVFSIRMMHTAFYVLRAVCPFCVISAVTMTTVFVLNTLHVVGLGVALPMALAIIWGARMGWRKAPERYIHALQPQAEMA